LVRSGGLCDGCLERGLTAIPPARSKSRATSHTTSTRKRRSRGESAGRAKAKLAKARAARRLADCFPEIYRLIYAEERAALGLPPVPLQATPSFNAERYEAEMLAAGAHYDVAAFYDALRAEGIEVE